MPDAQLPPLQLLGELSRRYPGAWRQFEDFREHPPEPWPRWCYCPMSGADAIVRAAQTDLADVAPLAAAAAWRVTQRIYRYHPELARALLDTPLDGALPIELLYALPDWCVYLELDVPGTLPAAGALAHLEHDSKTGRPELRFLFHVAGTWTPVMLHLDRPTLREAIDAAMDEADRQARAHGSAFRVDRLVTAPLLRITGAWTSALLYLCSERPDVSAGVWPPRRPRPTKIKRGRVLLPPRAPELVEVGAKLGPALEAAQRAPEEGARADGERRLPIGHIRRAHWHTYLVGPGRSQRVLRWLSPIAVGLDGQLPTPTVRDVS